MPYRCSKYDEINYRLLLDGCVVGWIRKFGAVWEASDKRSRGVGKTVVEAFDDFCRQAEKLRKPKPNNVDHLVRVAPRRHDKRKQQQDLPLQQRPEPTVRDFGTIPFNIVGASYETAATA